MVNLILFVDDHGDVFTCVYLCLLKDDHRDIWLASFGEHTLHCVDSSYDISLTLSTRRR